MSVKVEPRRNESVERMLQRFKKIVNKEGILRETRKRREYEKPSAKRRRERKERDKNRRRQEQQRTDPAFKKKPRSPGSQF